MDRFHQMIIMGISASVGLTVFLFGIEWDFLTGLSEDVSVVREDVAYMKGLMENYWLNGTG